MKWKASAKEWESGILMLVLKQHTKLYISGPAPDVHK